MEPWIELESAGCPFVDEWLGKFFQRLLEQMAAGIGRRLPLASGEGGQVTALIIKLPRGRGWGSVGGGLFG